MTESVERRVEELFHRLADLELDQRERALAAECAGDAVLAQRVERLLAASERMPGQFLAGKLEHPRAAPGQTLGGYELVELIGEGGMGAVFAARQASPAREVALKVLRPGRVSKSSLRRFRNEAEVLGNLEHPGIARIYEAGVGQLADLDGQLREVPFFAMELVRGVPLLEHARLRSLDVRSRVELLARVCDAVHHAHLRGVVHRDLKSENVLVVDEHPVPGGSDRLQPGQPKILDFGIARAVGSTSDMRTLETGVGDILGTLSAMSPEQAEGDSRLVDARSDVYALGVMLYQLLSGRAPLDLSDLPLPEALRRIREQLPRPLAELAPALPEDLSVIAAKALRKEPERRYQSVAALAADVRRWLQGRAIEARSDSALYVLGKGLARYRRLVATLLLALAGTVAFALSSLRQANENRHLAQRETHARRMAERALATSEIERGRLLAREGNPESERILWRQLFEQPDSEHARWALWELYSHSTILASRRGHPEQVLALAFAPDGSLFATGGADGAVALWEPETLEPRGRLEAGAGDVSALTFLADSRTLVGGNERGGLSFWDLASRTRTDVEAHSALVRGLALQPGGELLVSAAEDGTVRLFDLDPTGLPTGTGRLLEQRPSKLWSAVWSQDGQRLATCGRDGVRLWRPPFDAPERELLGIEPDVLCASFTDGGRRLWAGGVMRRLVAWNTDTGAVEVDLELENGTLRRMWTAGDGLSIFVSGWWRVEQRDARTGELLRSMPVHDMPWGVAVGPDERVLAAGDNRGVVRLWHLAEDSAFRALAAGNGRAAALDPSAARAAVCEQDGILVVVEVDSGRELWRAPADGATLRRLAFSPDGSLVLSTGGEAVRLFDAASGQPLRTFEGVNVDTGLSADFDARGERLAASCRGSVFRVWEVASGRELLVLQDSGTEALSVRWSPDDRLLATTARQRESISLWDTRSGEVVAELGVPNERPWTFDFSSDGRYLAAGTWEGSIQVWDVETRSLHARLEGHSQVIWDVACIEGRPDLVASVSADGAFRLWSLSEARNLLTLDVPGETPAYDLESCPTGDWLAVSRVEGGTLLFDLAHHHRDLAANLRSRWEDVAADLPLAPELEAWAEEQLSRGR